MNFSIPTDAMGQIGSTTSGLIVAYSTPAYIVIGMLLAFFVIERLIDAVYPSTPTGSHDSGV